MELLYLYVHNDKKSIKGCEYNFSPNYKFTYNAATKTFHMEWHRDNLPHKWFGENILNMTAIIGKNASGKTNLMECIIKSLCGRGGGWIIYLHEGQLYTNVPILYPDIKFSFDIKRFSQWGSPLNGEFKEKISDTGVIFYSTSVDRPLSKRNSYYSKFKDISNAFLLRKHISAIGNTPEFAHISDIDVMQTGDILRLLLFLIYSRDASQNILSSIPIAVPDIEIQTQIGRIVEEIIGRKSANDNASIQDLENQIDNIVYHLYNLTYDEILIVDPQTPISQEEYKFLND